MSYELIELPEGWQLTTVSEAIQIIDYRGRTPPFSSSGIPHLRSSNIRNGQIILDGLVYVSEETYQTYMTRGIPQKGDVLFTTEAPLGEVALAPDYKFSLAQRMMILRPMNKLLLSKFLLYQIQSESFQRKLKTSSTGSTVTGVSSRNFQPLELVIPPLNEQKRIVAKIEALRERSRRAREALFEIPGLCDRFRQSVLAAAFRGDLTADWREQNPDVEPASVLLEHTQKDKDNFLGKHQELSTVQHDDLPELPNSWAWTVTENLSKFESNAICAGPFGTIFKAKDFRDSGIPIIFLRHVGEGKYLTDKPGFMDVNKWEELFKPYSVWGGELLITKLGEPPGSCAIYPEDIGPAMVTPDVIKMSVNTEAALRHYLMYYFNSAISKKIAFGVAYGVTRLRMNLSIFRKLPIPLAPLLEQQEITRRIQILYRIADKVEQQYQEAKAYLDQLDQSILAKAFRGELVPQDPNDEPASILLERIKAEREQLGEKKKTTRKSPAPRNRKAKTETPTFEQMTIPGLEIPDNRNEQTQK